MYSIAIKNGLVIDGTGAAPFRANVYISGETVAKISSEDLPAEQVINAEGLAVAPGFIDIHTHSDGAPYITPAYETCLHQGVTLNIAGNCGTSLFPHKAERHDLTARDQTQRRYSRTLTGDMYKAMTGKEHAAEIDGKIAVNSGVLVGHDALRYLAMADPFAVEPTEEELREMCEALDKELSEGAFGLSFGLPYVPCSKCKTEELVTLSKVAAKHGVPVTVHMRSESKKIREALAEVKRIGLESGAHMHISHFKWMYPGENDHAEELLAIADQMRKDGVNLTMDAYPYTATSTGLTACFPGWANHGENDETLAFYTDEETWAKMLPEVTANLAFRGGPDKVMVAYTHGNVPECEGKTVAQCAKILKKSPEEALREIMIRSRVSVQGVFFAMREEDVYTMARREDVAVISDGYAMNFISEPLAGFPHPRACNTFAHFLRMNREQKLLPIEKAVRKMTSLPAEILSIDRRGVLKEGYFADVTVFDPETAGDTGTYTNPGSRAEGIHTVLVNGTVAWKDGNPTGSRSGHGLLRK